VFIVGSSGNRAPKDGDFIGVGGCGSWAHVAVLMPVSGTFSDLRVHLAKPPGAGQMLGLGIFINNVATGTGVYPSGSTTTAHDATGTAAVSAGDEVAIRIVSENGTSPTLSAVTWSAVIS